MGAIKDLELTFRGVLSEVEDSPHLFLWWDRLRDGATYRPDPDFVGWATFVDTRFGWVYFVDVSTSLCYGPVSEGIGDIFLSFLVHVQTEETLPTNL